MARDGAAPTEWADLCRAARRAERQGRVRVVGVMGHLACADDPGDPAQRAGPGPVRLGPRDARAAAGLRPRRPAPGRDVGHPDRPAQPPHDEPGRRRPGRHRPVRARTAAAAGADADRAAGQRPPGARRHRGRLRAHLDRAAGDPARAAPARVRRRPAPASPPAAPRCWSRGRRRPLVGRISMDMAVVDLGDRPGGRAATWSPSSAPATTASPPRPSGPPGPSTIEHEIVTGLGARLHRAVAPDLRSVR